MTFILLLVGAYLVGSIPFGVLASKARGVDIFQIGSGSTGATNVNRALGWKWGAVVFILDLLKALLPTLLARHLYPNSEARWILTGFMAMLGHCFSPFLKFKGGKGVACLMGMICAANPIIAASCFGLFFVIVLITRYISLGSIIAVPFSAVLATAMHKPPATIGLLAMVGALTVWLHRANLKRLLNGTESKFGKKKTEPST